MSACIQLFINFYTFIKSRLVFHVPVNSFVPRIFYSYNTNQLGMVKHFHFLLVNQLIEKSYI